MTEISDLVGVTLDAITVTDGMDEIIFYARDGRKWRMFHDQECCESVTIDDICGDVTDLLLEPILRAEERVSEGDEPFPREEWDESWTWTWTFYELATIKGSVTVRWYGTSSGCYSERVSFEMIPGAHPITAAKER